MDQVVQKVSRGKRTGGKSPRKLEAEPVDHRTGRIAALVVALISFLVYIRTLSPGMQMGDGTELATCAQVLGVPHPTGYPLYMLLAKLWLIVTIGGEVIVRTTLLNAVIMSAAAYLTTRVADLLLAGVFPLWSEKARLFAAAAAGLSSAFLRFHWENAVVTEVYALQFLLMLGFVACVLSSERAVTQKRVVAAALIVGLGLAHHRMTVFLLLPMVWLWIRAWKDLPAVQRGRTLAFSAGVIALCLSLYAYIPLRASARLHWGNTRTWSGFIEHVRGTEYLTRSFLRPAQGREFTAETYVTFAARETAQIAGDFVGQFAPLNEEYYYDRYVERIFLAPGWRAVLLLLVLAPIGLYGALLWKRAARRTFWVTAVVSAQNVIVLFIYNILDIRDYYLFPMWFGWICVWFGALGAVRVLSERRLLFAPAARYASLLIPALIGTANFPRSDQSQNDAAERLSATILPNLPEDRVAEDSDVLPNSIVMTGGDFDSFTSWYRQLVRKQRTDVLIFGTNFIWKPWYADYFTPEQKQRYRLKLAANVATGPDAFARQLAEGIIDANIHNTPIYTCLQDPAVLMELSKMYRLRHVSSNWLQQERTSAQGTTITLYRIQPRT
ncbi:MAG: protein O-mannosyl-transferase family [Candidatus Sumerlaeaceae bacterium]